MYDDYEERIVMMPASSVAHYHNAFAGGYVDHVLRVMNCAKKLYDAWRLIWVLICQDILNKK